MAVRFLNKKSERFYFINNNGERVSYVLIFGDEVKTLTGSAPSGAEWDPVEYRKKKGEVKGPKWTNKRTLEMYFLDVGQGDAAFLVTPNNTKILVDGGLGDHARGFLIWRYRLDEASTPVEIDYLILSHGDKDHVEGLIPILKHPMIKVKNILHNGIGVFESGFNKDLGNVTSGRLTTLHNLTGDLNGLDLANTFGDWIQAVKDSGADYKAVDSTTGVFDIGDPKITLEILGPVLEPGGNSLKWFSNKAHTINGHSVIFRLTYDKVRVFFSGDLNTKGSKHVLSKLPDAPDKLDAHIFKTPHHGSHDYHQELFDEIQPMISVVSSGDSPDHGHPRALFLGGLGLAGRSKKPLIFSTEIAATFTDAGDTQPPNASEPTTLGDLDLSSSIDNETARKRFKKTLPGIINVRTDGKVIYSARRVLAGYQWEAYGPIKPVDKKTD